MSRLEDALEAAEQRKEAAFPEGTIGVASGEFESRAIFSGFDVDHDELNRFATLAGNVFYAALMQGDIAPRHAFSAAWTEGFLIGLMFTRETD